MSWLERRGGRGRRRPRCGYRPGGQPARAWWEFDGVMLYLGTRCLYAVTCTRYGRVVDAVSVCLTGQEGRQELLTTCEGLANMALTRRHRIAEGQAVDLRVKACELSKKFPTLWEFLTKTSWGKDDPRIPGTLFLMMQDGILKASVSDRDSCEVLWVSGQSLTELIEVVDAALNDPGADWRVDRKALERGQANGNGKAVDKKRGRR